MRLKIKNSSKHLEETGRKFPFSFIVLLRNQGKSLLLCLQLFKQYNKQKNSEKYPELKGITFHTFSVDDRTKTSVSGMNES